VIAFGLTPLRIRKSTTGANTRWKPDLANSDRAMKVSEVVRVPAPEDAEES